jgi:hypothetical protein
MPYTPRQIILNRSFRLGGGDARDLLPSVMKISTTLSRAVACTLRSKVSCVKACWVRIVTCMCGRRRGLYW